MKLNMILYSDLSYEIPNEKKNILSTKKKKDSFRLKLLYEHEFIVLIKEYGEFLIKVMKLFN